jgi:hypothetical protein
MRDIWILQQIKAASDDASGLTRDRDSTTGERPLGFLSRSGRQQVQPLRKTEDRMASLVECGHTPYLTFDLFR